MSACAWLRELDGDLRLTIYVQPSAKKTEVCGVYRDALKIKLAAPPVDGKANETLRRFLAETFAVPMRNIMLERGQNARQKTILIHAPAQRPDWARPDSSA
ncbi:MAG: DUF167 family protein [Burkholderiales bacterium]|jgi:uncharacterized protein (TIGR00251 family)|nr:DUF167 family protein [Burkholderiales bacterium]